MNDPLTEVKFWSMVIEDMRQTIVCSPEMESRLKTFIQTRGMAGIITVVANPVCPDNRLFVLPATPPDTLT